MNRSNQIKFLGLCIGIVALFFLDISLGSITIPLQDTWKVLTFQSIDSTSFETIILQFRLPKAITAILVGMALPISGLLMQTYFRNPIAGPYVLGISSGAGLGVALLVLTTNVLWFADINQWSIVIAGAVGAFGVLLVVLSVSWKVRDAVTLLIVGLMIGSLTSSIITVLQYFSGDAMLKRFVMWSFGSLSGVTFSEIYVLAPIVLLSVGLVYALSKSLNAILLGEEYAITLGVDIKQFRWKVLVLTALLAGGITAFCGPIGFIGIAVPHLARLLFKSQQHNIIIPASALIGMMVMLVCDIIAQVPFSDISLPINAITSLFGAPLVIWIIIKRS